MKVVNRGSEEVPFGFVYTDDEERRSTFTVNLAGGEITLGSSGSGYFAGLTAGERMDALRLLADRYGGAFILDS